MKIISFWALTMCQFLLWILRNHLIEFSKQLYEVDIVCAHEKTKA